MRERLYQWFKKFFWSEIDLELRHASEKSGNTLSRRYTEGYEKGYADAQEYLENMVDERAMHKFTALNWLVNPAHVFQVSQSGLPYLNLEKISKSQAKELQSQVKVIQAMPLWSILKETVRERAIIQALHSSTEWSHVLPGKMMIYNLTVWDSIFDNILKIDINKIPDIDTHEGVL